MITFTNLGASSGTTAVNPDILDTSDSATYANSAWTPPVDLLLCYIFSGDGQEPSTITGNSLTWELIISTIYKSSSRGISFWAANSIGATNGATTITFSSPTTACYALFFSVASADLSNGVVAAFLSYDGNGTGTSGSISASPPTHPENRVIACFSHDADEVVTGRALWTQLDDLHGAAPVNGILSEYRGDAFEITSSASWVSNVAWGGLMSEVKAASVPELSPAPFIQGYGAM